MAPLFFGGIKAFKLSCTSSASSAISKSIERRSVARPSTARTVHRINNPKSDTKILKEGIEEPNELTSPGGSSRYLLNNSTEPIPALLYIESSRVQRLKGDETLVLPSLSSSARLKQNQVVVLRVSIHCKGCEGKVRRHISKMEGVTSFAIDLAAKKVTVMGDVTPLGVLSSVSKVKHAQFWAWPTSPPASFESHMYHSSPRIS